MSDILFARTRHEYQPYTDFWSVVAASGFRIVPIDEVNWGERVTVIATPHNGEWLNIPRQRRARLIHWNFERLIDSADPHDMSATTKHPYIDEFWAADRAMAQKWDAKYVFFGGCRGMATLDFRHKRFDMISLMYWSGRRQGFAGSIARFSRADAAGGGWGDERHRKLIASRMMLTVHQDEAKWCEPIRFTLAGHYALPLASETCADSGYWEPGVHYLAGSWDELPALADRVLGDPTLAARLGANAWRLVVEERPLRQEVKAAL